MADQDEQYEMSWILHHILDRFIGSPEIVETRRWRTLQNELILNGRTQGLGLPSRTFYTGSQSEGFNMESSDIDTMAIDNNVIVLCPLKDSSIPQDSKDKTVFMMRDADSRPGYVNLELVNLVPTCNKEIDQSIVGDRNAHFLSSEMFRRNYADEFSNMTNSILETHGPAVTLTSVQNKLYCDNDLVFAFHCARWPHEGYEWVSRPRQHSWPDKALRDEIVQGGCHLVPVGDRTSADTFLQWRISFATAERKLIHSLTHTQFLIYGLLKYFLKQISDRLKQIFGDEDILSSYIMKTVIFYAVESTPGSFWQEKNTFFCFMLCFKILIAWVNAGYCPNFFISNNNMFCGKVQGENQQKLFHMLIELYDTKWECLSVGTVIQQPLGIVLQNVRNGAWELVLRPSIESEVTCDMEIFFAAFISDISSDFFSRSLSLLSKAQLGSDEFLAYTTTLRAMCCIGMDTFEKHIPAKGNKEKYKFLRKCKNLMTPLSSVCTGLLTLATYHYQVGNYTKTLEMCTIMLSAFTIDPSFSLNYKEKNIYENLYCGRGYTLLHKCQQVCVSNVEFPWTVSQLCPSQLHPELNIINFDDVLTIPALPYAVFLTFLCNHELIDTRRRDAALIHLRAVKYDEKQGVGHYWIVHNLLGICYEMVGDTRRALREYRDSLDVRRFDQYNNPARRRIERLQNDQ
ncbi:uncharacterized protein LOC110461283 [Mizuhopecten yessoensis]|uniref:Protein mab-21 n=1 Tax=Mizuhopecten yessoensis TaxID=6573 RepID=A0A210Q0Q5_MIZYE|nr:uncharacterized protein LOC110461283 [Mizuhopecten yessoensis]XP_021370377.1 uncharacterized protein LOC110461283 [Mizuhopecten yessoensis]XP_021370378.1 uncharacterized protein LOC110461283 [Mizuhopecten yessoensis]OWF42316.1 Protein mab-21 [Mizuhopecten yessoensis]